VLVEGISDQVALVTLARRRGLDLDAKRISVSDGGAQAVDGS
jgi:predicted ATP-dependent endonuclease of OLD family